MARRNTAMLADGTLRVGTHITHSEDLQTEVPPSVLLVDDDEVNLMVTALALRDRGFFVTEVSSGDAALDHLRQQVPDIVVLDAMMPGLNGFDTCLQIRSIPGLEHVPVLMLTGLDDDESISHAYRVGATDFFVKSPQWRLLDGRIRYLLRASSTRQELLRSRARLARAQDLARMGSFEWHSVPAAWICHARLCGSSGCPMAAAWACDSSSAWCLAPSVTASCACWWT